MRPRYPPHLTTFEYVGLHRYSLTFCTHRRRPVFITADVVTSDGSDCKRFIARAKQYSGFYYAKHYHQVLWQRYGFEHVLRDDEVTRIVARYILENPIRAGLVQRIEDYPFVGSRAYTVQELMDGITGSS